MCVMKKLNLLIIFILPLIFMVKKSAAQVNNVGNVVTNSTDQHANNDINSTVNGGLDKAENGIKGLFKKKKKPTAADSAKKTLPPGTVVSPTGTVPGAAATSAPPSFSTYQNYDFVPGEQIIFEDEFADDQDGEFPTHWKLLKGQAVINKVDAKPSLLLSEYQGEIMPRMKTDAYLPDVFTFEFDFIYKKYKDAGYLTNYFSDPLGLEFYYKDPTGRQSNPAYRVVLSRTDVKIGDLDKSYPDDLLTGFDEKWHHAAIIYKNGQMKVYVDQYRICVNPNIDNKPLRLSFDDLGFSKNNPIIFTNIKLASGGGMNMVGKKFTDAKIVTHGINFDVNKAVIKPESMGTLNGIVKIMQDNPEVKFEVGGHTDNDGSDDVNMKLSQARADAVRTQLIAMGIDAGRLTTKGYGSTKPVSDNTTAEGKANNRRVEFVRL
jgi:OmpA-OmpF porin, OOP family